MKRNFRFTKQELEKLDYLQKTLNMKASHVIEKCIAEREDLEKTQLSHVDTPLANNEKCLSISPKSLEELKAFATLRVRSIFEQTRFFVNALYEKLK